MDRISERSSRSTRNGRLLNRERKKKPISFKRDRRRGTAWTVAQTCFTSSRYGSSSERTKDTSVILWPCCERYLNTCQVFTFGPDVGGYGRIWVRKRICIRINNHTWKEQCFVPIRRFGSLVVCWLNNARNSLPGLAEHGSVGHLPKMGDEPCVVASQRNFS
jgi:hypothetical protein